MPQLLIEFFSEEIPARMQKRAEEDLARLLHEKFLVGTGHGSRNVRTFSTPRRLVAVVDDLETQTDEPFQTRKGPKVGAPEQAVEGFLKSTGLLSIAEAQIEGEPGKEFYVARYRRPSLSTADVLKSAIPEIVRGFPWPKSMRSGASDLTWVRPLQNILCLFGGAPVRIDVEGVGSEPTTWGHRFHAPDAITPKDFTDYAAKLRAAKVLIDREERKALILEQARRLCADKNLELVEDIGLLEEVAGLVEWPVVLLGEMDGAFLDLPGEVIRLSMRTHQKYFAVRNSKTGALAPHFIVVANIEAKDGGKAIAAGNARVLSARLNDARFFWDGDRKTPLFTEERRAKLQKIVFHQKLGSVWDKVERVKALAVELCAVTGADVALVSRAAELCKMDLVTETVGEFPELQGQIGRALAAQQRTFSLAEKVAAKRPDEGRADSPAPDRSHAPHPPTPSPPRDREAIPRSLDSPAAERPVGGGGAREHPSVAAAIEDHYRPLGPNDRVPSDPVAVTLALADKLDTLVGFWAIDEKPTGSSDPYALRRAALGLVRIVLHNNIRFTKPSPPLRGRGLGEEGRADAPATARLHAPHPPTPSPQGGGGADLRHWILFALGELLRKRGLSIGWLQLRNFSFRDQVFGDSTLSDSALSLALAPEDAECLKRVARGPNDLLSFLADRLKVQLREQGKRHDLVDAVFALGDDDLVRIVARVEALDAFLKTEAGVNLLAAYKRAANILAAEEKKGKWSAAEAQGAVDASKLVEPAEKAVYAALEAAIPQARAAVEREDFAGAMGALAGLRAPVDAFFEKVLVNDPDQALRRNRLLLLSRLREALSAVADFSKIEG